MSFLWFLRWDFSCIGPSSSDCMYNFSKLARNARLPWPQTRHMYDNVHTVLTCPAPLGPSPPVGDPIVFPNPWFLLFIGILRLRIRSSSTWMRKGRRCHRRGRFIPPRSIQRAVCSGWGPGAGTTSPPPPPPPPPLPPPSPDLQVRQVTSYTAKTKNTEISKQIFPEKEYRGLGPNVHINASVSDLYISTISLSILLEEICRPILGLYKTLTDTWMWKMRLRPLYSQKRNT